jgi:hypothetical protein
VDVYVATWVGGGGCNLQGVGGQIFVNLQLCRLGGNAAMLFCIVN